MGKKQRKKNEQESRRTMIEVTFKILKIVVDWKTSNNSKKKKAKITKCYDEQKVM